MTTKLIDDRVEEILANCGHEVDDDKTALLEQIIDDKEIIGLIMDLADRTVTRAGKPVRLTPLEYDLLTLLVRNCGKVLTSAQILDQVWGRDYVAEVQILRTHICRLRSKIELDNSLPTIILTEPGVGYRLIG